MGWLFVFVSLLGLVVTAWVSWPALSRGRQWSALLVVQTPAHQQFYHRVTVRAAGRVEAKTKALRIGSRRFPDFGIQVDEVNPCS